MKTQIIFTALLSLSLFGFWLPNNISAQETQALTDHRVINVRRTVKILGKPKLIEKNNIQLDITLTPFPEKFYIVSLANPVDGTYFAKRFTSKGIEAFAKTPGFIETLRKDSKKEVVIKGKVDLAEPYVIQEKNNRYLIRSYKRPEELKTFFTILNQLLLKRAIPKINRLPELPIEYDEAQIGEGLLFECKEKKKCFWQ